MEFLYNPYKWPYKWGTGAITLLTGVITSFKTDRGPPCIQRGNFWRTKSGFPKTFHLRQVNIIPIPLKEYTSDIEVKFWLVLNPHLVAHLIITKHSPELYTYGRYRFIVISCCLCFFSSFPVVCIPLDPKTMKNEGFKPSNMGYNP